MSSHLCYRHKRAHRRVWFALALLLLFAANVAVLADTHALALELIPGSVRLAPGQTAVVTIVARNPTNETAESLVLGWFTNTNLQVAVKEKSATDTLPPGADAAWVLAVQNSGRNPTAGVIHVRLDYQLLASSGTPSPRVLFGELAVTVPTLAPAGDVAAVRVASTLTALNEQRPDRIHLILENKHAAPLEVRDLRLKAPEYIRLRPLASILNTIVEPRQQLVLPIEVEADRRVQPGKRLLLFEVDVTWQEGGQPQQTTYVTTHEVEVGVFGESEILTLLGVPAFFLLPGFLFLTAIKVIWGFRKTPEEAKAWPLPWSSTEFWAMAVTLSLLATLIYPLVTEWWLGVRRDYLQAYGLEDVFYLWFGSVAFGVLTYSTSKSGLWLLHWRQQKRLAARTPAESDSPAELLRKLEKQGLTLWRDAVSLSFKDEQQNEPSHRAFLLQARDMNATGCWVGPLIYITNRDDLSQVVEDQVNALVSQAGAADSLKKLQRLLPQLELKYDPSWPRKGPYFVKKEDIATFETPRPILTFE